MSQPELTLYHFPGACSQVTVCALEQAGLTYKLELVNLAANEQQESAFLEISPHGKVPTLLIDGTPLTENPAILFYAHNLRPDAGLFPPAASVRERAEAQAGLSFCSGTLHPQVRGIVNPGRLTVGDGEPVRERSTQLARKSFGYAEQRLAARGWWFDEWSIVDVYLNWAFTVAGKNGFDGSDYPRLTALADRLAEYPAFARMTEEEVRSREALGL